MSFYGKNATYKISEICWDMTPSSTFMLQSGEEISFEKYYMDKYQQKITDRG